MVLPSEAGVTGQAAIALSLNASPAKNLTEFMGIDKEIEKELTKQIAAKEAKNKKKDFWALPWYIKWPIVAAFLGILTMFFLSDLISEQQTLEADSPDS